MTSKQNKYRRCQTRQRLVCSWHNGSALVPARVCIATAIRKTRICKANMQVSPTDKAHMLSFTCSLCSRPKGSALVPARVCIVIANSQQLGLETKTIQANMYKFRYLECSASRVDSVCSRPKGSALVPARVCIVTANSQ